MNGALPTRPEPVAICRLKRVATDHKGDVKARMPALAPRNGKRVACVGAGPASLTVARDLAPLRYEVTMFDGEAKAGGFMRTQIPQFRLPEEVIDEETGYVLDLGMPVIRKKVWTTSTTWNGCCASSRPQPAWCRSQCCALRRKKRGGA
jgi:NADPH-dependent glutamate synthase beta subunit-like oxidoreductase